MANHRGGSGNFAEDRERASEAGRKGGQSSGGNFKNDPQRASEAGKEGGKNSHGSNKSYAGLIPCRRDLAAVFYFCNIELSPKASHTRGLMLICWCRMSLSRFTFSVKPQEALLILITMFWGGTF